VMLKLIHHPASNSGLTQKKITLLYQTVGA